MKISLQHSLVLCAFAATSVATAAPFLKLAENTHLHLLADAEFVYETNLFQSSFAERSDRYLVFSPGIELRMASEGAASAILRYQHKFTAFRDFHELNGDYSDLSFQARYNSGRVMASARASYEELFSDVFDVFNLDARLIEREVWGVGGDLRYELSELTAFKVGAELKETDYEDAIYADHETLTVPLTFFYKVRPRVDLTAGVRYRETDISGQNRLVTNTEDFYYFIGAVGELFSPVLYADVSIGFQEREFDGIDEDADSASYDITLIYTGDVKTTVYAGLSRDYRTSAVGGLSYAFTSASLGARYNFSESIGLNASVVYGESEYEGSPRAEDMTIMNIGASYHPNDTLTLSASYKYTDVEGKNIFSADYDNSQFRVSASLRY